MYAVVSGCKTFTLLPPTDVLFLPEATFSTKKYSLTQECRDRLGDSSGTNSSRLLKSDLILSTEGECPEEISWIPADPEDPSWYVKHRAMEKCTPLRCRVMPGEVLYIPSMWYHRVSQTELTVAVNFWYDQRFNFRYALYNYVKNTKKLVGKNDELDDEINDA